MHEPYRQVPTPPEHDEAPSTHGREDHARFVWGVAGQLAAGMLANDGKQHYSVKDSISLFDEVLHELTAYARVRGDFDEYVEDRAAQNEVRRELQRQVTLGEASRPGVGDDRPPGPARSIRQPAPATGIQAAPVPTSMSPAPMTSPVSPHAGADRIATSMGLGGLPDLPALPDLPDLPALPGQPG